MASDESSMSSESRIRQFGLYRSIDARTEEFLRLSRKRQLRQGCACAAASTAITVTVVIVIFFVYEFSLNSGTNSMNSLKSGWLSLMNDTSQDSFDPKLTNANIDRTTLKLLPLLIKAIKKNVVLEKLLDDQSGANPFYDKKDTKEVVEDSDEQNSFSQSWVKMPATKLYTIEYKTSPVVYYRNPTKNIEYYTKIRKIRDYQRVFNYVDKMISEKVYIRSSKPMQKEESRTEPTIQSRFKKNTDKPTIRSKILTNMSNIDNNNVRKENKFHCKCPKNLGKLLQKILSGLDNSLPKSAHINTQLIGCDNNITVKSPKTKTIDNLFDLQSSQIPVKLQKNSTEKLKSNYNFKPQHIQNAFTLDSATESYSFNNNNYSVDSRSDGQNNSQNIFTNKYKSIINEKQTLKRPELISKIEPKVILEPIFGGVEYDDSEYYTSTLRNKPIDNTIQYMATKANYLNDVMLKNYKLTTNTPVKYKKNKSKLASKNSVILDMQVVDNKIALVKTKPTHTSNSNLVNYSYIMPKHLKFFDNVTNTPTQSSNWDKITTEEEITFGMVNSKLVNLDEVDKKRSSKNFDTNLPIQNSNFVTLKPKHFRYSTNSQDDKTIYHLVKNSIQNYLNKTSKTTPTINRSNYNNANMLYESKKKCKFRKENKTAIYMLIENHVNTFLRKNLSDLKEKLKKTKAKLHKVQKYKNNGIMTRKSSIITTLKPFADSILLTSQNDSTLKFNKIATTSEPDSYTVSMSQKLKESNIGINNDEIKLPVNHIRGELPSSPDPDDGDDGEFFITENTKPPERSTYENDSDSLLVKKTQDLTWEDLTNEFMPAWRSIIPDPTVYRSNKPLFVEYHKTDDKPDVHQEDDFSMNNNFYDLNI